MCSLIGQSPVASSASATGGYSHFPSYVRQAVILLIRQAGWWLKPSNTFIITTVITHILLPYSSTVWATTLHSIPLARTVAPIFSESLRSSPIADEPSSGCDTQPPNLYWVISLHCHIEPVPSSCPKDRPKDIFTGHINQRDQWALTSSALSHQELFGFYSYAL